MQKIVIIGATSSMAEHCARLWAAAEPCAFYLLARDAEKLQNVKNDLLVRSPQSQIETASFDFLDTAKIKDFAQHCAEGAPIDIVLIAHGTLPDQDAAQNDLDLCKSSLMTNAVSAALFMEAFATQLEKSAHGKLAVIGSVAGDRGRKSNYIYGAPKGLIARYAQGLQHRFAGSNIHVILIKPGPTDPPMKTDFSAKGGKRTRVEIVAAQIVRGIAKNKTTIYTPPLWALIMWIIRHLPAFIFNKLNI